MSRRLLAALALVLLISGCGSFANGPGHPTTNPSSSGVSPAADPAMAQQPAVEVPPDTPSALAHKTAAYAQQMQAQLEASVRARAAASAGPSTTPAATPEDAADSPVVPSEPKFLQQKDCRLHLFPPQAPSAAPAVSAPITPATAPAAGTPAVAAANQSASVSPGPAAATPSATVAGAAVSSDELEQKLARQVKDYPKDLAAQLDWQLLQFVNGRHTSQQAMDATAALPAEDREIILATMDALTNFRNSVRGEENLMLVRKVRPLVDLGDRLRSQGTLRIPTIALCSRVDGFGVYEPLESDRFLAGREHQAIVYCEIDNFASSMGDRQQWRTDLTQQLVLYSEKGQRVWDDKSRTVSDLSRNRRRDFFLVRLMKLPATLAPGRYYLKVTISDQQAARVAEASVPVSIVVDKESK